MSRTVYERQKTEAAPKSEKVAQRGQNRRVVEVNVPRCGDISTKVCVIKSPPPPSTSVHQQFMVEDQSARLVLYRIEESIHAPQVGCQLFNSACQPS